MQASRGSDFARPGEGDARSKVLAAVDLVQLIGQSVSLKRRGRDYVGLCPFHQEKTPSFHVVPDKQYFKCFGCKASGTAFDFVMLRDRVEFKDALTSLAEQYNVELPRFGGSKQAAGEKQLLLEAQSAAGAFFENFLKSPAGKGGRDYLAERGFNDASVQAFQIGQSAEAWDALIKSPGLRKFPPGILSLAGLVKPRTNGEGFYDTFRHRLMFPIRDENGRVIAFGGRKMPGSEDPAKYLNSPETPLFSKSRSLFGIDLARKRIVETRTVAVVEGYTDVVMAHQFGCTNVVAALGTALTEQHIGLLRRFADRVVLLFDADEAGDSAVDRAVELFLTQPIEIAIAGMPDGLDPDEFLLQRGQAAFDALLAGASDALSYKWKQLNRRFADADDDLTGQQKAVETYLGTLASARQAGPVDSIRWGSALTRVSRLTGIPVEELNKRFKASRSVIRRPAASPQAAENASPAREPANRRGPLSATDRAERWLLGIVLNEPGRWQKVQQSVHSSDFSSLDRRQLAERFWEHQRHEGATVLQEFLAEVNDRELTELAVELSMEASELSDAEGTLASTLEHFAQERERQAGRKLVADLRRREEGESSPDMSADAEIELLRQLSAHAGKADMKRI